jgi:hypothetical protein
MTLITIAQFATEAEAHMAKNFLEGEEIISYVAGGTTSPLTEGVPFGGVLQVERKDVEKATFLLQRIKKSPQKNEPIEWARRVYKVSSWLLIGSIGAVLLLLLLGALALLLLNFLSHLGVRVSTI